jgi:broad specificity phosphatase PhoE
MAATLSYCRTPYSPCQLNNNNNHYKQEDEKRKLTELGRVQAELTGKRLREMIDVVVSSSMNNSSNGGGGDEDSTSKARATFSCRVKALRVSDMTRAKETASIIASFLPLQGGGSTDDDTSSSKNDVGVVTYHPPDPSLNEGRPCHHIPGVKATPKVIEVTDDNHRRIEEAFQRYFYRSDPPQLPPTLMVQGGAVAAAGSAAAAAAAEPPPPQSESNVPTAPQPPAAESAAAAPATTTTTAATLAHSVQEHHEFEIIVCHANVIRYFVCRCVCSPQRDGSSFALVLASDPSSLCCCCSTLFLVASSFLLLGPGPCSSLPRRGCGSARSTAR